MLGLGPLAHLHSFLAMGFTIVSFSVIDFFKKGKDLFKKNCLILVSAGVISLPLVLLFSGAGEKVFFGNHPFIQFRLGWMADPTTIGGVKYPSQNPSLIQASLSYLNFLWFNFGVILPGFIFGSLLAFKKKVTWLYPYMLTAGILFLIVQTVKLQPWDYDNNKLLDYFLFFAIPVLLYPFVYLMRRFRKISLLLLAVFFAAAIFSGVMDTLPRYIIKAEAMPVAFDKNAIAIANFIRGNVDKNAQILTSSTHLNPVSSLAGRQVIIGYPGWLWTRGLDYGQKETDLKSFYADPDRRDILQKYNIKYILLDAMARNDWGAKEEMFTSRFELISQAGEFSLYKVK